MTVYQWDYEIVFPGRRGFELVRVGSVVTRTPRKGQTIRSVHRKIHVREFFQARVSDTPREVRV